MNRVKSFLIKIEKILSSITAAHFFHISYADIEVLQVAGVIVRVLKRFTVKATIYPKIAQTILLLERFKVINF